MEQIKIRVYKDPNLTKLVFYESKDSGEHWAYNGQLNLDPEIAIWLSDAIRRGGSGHTVAIFENDPMEQ